MNYIADSAKRQQEYCRLGKFIGKPSDCTFRKLLPFGTLEAMKMLDKIIDLVEERGWKEGAFESMAGLPQGRISKWKREGKGKGPSAKEALVMARILDVSLEWLVDDESGKPPKFASGIEEDERTLLRVYRDLRDEFGLTDEAARRSLMRAAGVAKALRRDDEEVEAQPVETAKPVVRAKPKSARKGTGGEP